MNKKIYFEDQLNLEPVMDIQIPKEHIVRVEKCPFCKVNLIEKFYKETTAPEEALDKVVGQKYKRFFKSDRVTCPKCNVLFGYDLTDPVLIEKYSIIANQGGFFKLTLIKDFVIERFETTLKKNLTTGTVMYSLKKDVWHLETKNYIAKIKEGYTMEKAWENNGSSFPIRKMEAWDFLPSISCVEDPQDFLEGDVSKIKNIPKECFLIK